MKMQHFFLFVLIAMQSAPSLADPSLAQEVDEPDFTLGLTLINDDERQVLAACIEQQREFNELDQAKVREVVDRVEWHDRLPTWVKRFGIALLLKYVAVKAFMIKQWGALRRTFSGAQ